MTKRSECEHDNFYYEPKDYWCGIPEATYTCEDCGGWAPEDRDDSSRYPLWEEIQYDGPDPDLEEEDEE